MRKLSDDEKSFINELIRISENSHDVFLANIIDRKLNNVDVYLDYISNIVDYRFDQNLYNNDPNQFIYYVREFTWKMRQYIQLLLDLEKNGMLFLFQESPNVANSRFGRLISGNQFIPSRINDLETTKLIIDYAKKTIIINESLKHFAKNDFRTDEEIRYEEEKETSIKSLKTAKNTLYITIGALILTMITSLLQIFSSNNDVENKNNLKVLKVLENIHYDIHSKR